MVKKNNVEAEYKPAYTLSLWPRNFWKLKLSDFKTLQSSDLYCKKKKKWFLRKLSCCECCVKCAGGQL